MIMSLFVIEQQIDSFLTVLLMEKILKGFSGLRIFVRFIGIWLACFYA